MIIKEITVGKSQQVVQYGMPEQWIKVSVTGEIGENENPANATDTLFAFLDEQLKKHLPETNHASPQHAGDLYFNVSKQKEERI